MTATYYYVYPFGENADDLVEIPTSAAGDGSVSYYAGYTDPYEYDLLTNPNALPVARGSFNQLMFQATSNIQQYQQYGTPNWISSADNLGSPFAYPIYARVYYGSNVYENIVADNTATPGADSTWLLVSGTSDSVQAGMIIDWAGPVAPNNWAIAIGQAVSRTTYATLFGNLTQAQTGTTTNTSAVITGLASTSGMYAGMEVEGTNIPSSTTILTVDSSTQITVSNAATGNGAVSIRFFYWGNGDGSTTFNLPNLLTKTTAGAGSSGYTFGEGLGQSGGSQTETIEVDMLPNHTHDRPSGRSFMCGGPGDIGYGSSGNSFQSETITGGLTGYTSQTAMSIVQPTTLVNKIIRLI